MVQFKCPSFPGRSWRRLSQQQLNSNDGEGKGMHLVVAVINATLSTSLSSSLLSPSTLLVILDDPTQGIVASQIVMHCRPTKVAANSWSMAVAAVARHWGGSGPPPYPP